MKTFLIYVIKLSRSRELLFLGSILCHDHREVELRDHYVGSDFNVFSCDLKRRPDMLFRFKNFALLIEFDEDNGHQHRKEGDELVHLQVISKWIQKTYDLEHVHVIRVNPDGPNPMYKQSKTTNGEPLWMLTSDGQKKTRYFLSQLCSVINSWLDGTTLESKNFDYELSYEDDVLMRITTKNV